MEIVLVTFAFGSFAANVAGAIVGGRYLRRVLNKLDQVEKRSVRLEGELAGVLRVLQLLGLEERAQRLAKGA